MLIGYFDESHDPSRRHSKWFAVGGFVAAAAEWQRFTPRWNGRLAAEGVAGRLHMREFEHGIGQFEGWSRDRRYQLIADLVDIINEHGLYGIGQAVDVDAFERVFVPALPTNDAATFGRPYVFCLQVCLEHIVAVRGILDVPADETVDLGGSGVASG